MKGKLPIYKLQLGTPASMEQYVYESVQTKFILYKICVWIRFQDRPKPPNLVPHMAGDLRFAQAHCFRFRYGDLFYLSMNTYFIFIYICNFGRDIIQNKPWLVVGAIIYWGLSFGSSSLLWFFLLGTTPFFSMRWQALLAGIILSE